MALPAAGSDARELYRDAAGLRLAVTLPLSSTPVVVLSSSLEWAAATRRVRSVRSVRRRVTRMAESVAASASPFSHNAA